MNVLTIPYIAGGDSHLIPLYVLHQRYIRRMGSINNYFLLADDKSSYFKNQNIEIVDVNYSLRIDRENINELLIREELFIKEFEAQKQVNPSIIIEDFCFSSPLIAEKNNIPRISIHRTGFFRSIDKSLRNHKHLHSIEKGQNGHGSSDIMTIICPKNFIKDPKTDGEFLKNYLNAKTKIIPGIPSIEVLPKNIKNKDSYFYSGPLLTEDNPSETLKSEIATFLDYNKNHKKVFITLGLIDKSTIDVYINYLINNGYAIITTVKTQINKENDSQFFYNPFLPLNYICSIIDIFIHQCGSGIYHYPILNEKASITIGTQCYDREDVALRLEELSVSRHVPHVDDNQNHLEIFIKHIKSFEEDTLCDFSKLKELKEEIFETMISFDIKEVFDYALKSKLKTF